MAAAADPRAAKQPSSHPLPRPVFPIPARWGQRRPPHHRAEARRGAAASFAVDRTLPPPQTDSGARSVLLPSLGRDGGKAERVAGECGSGSGSACSGATAGGGVDEDAGLEELRAKLIREAADRLGAVTVTPPEQPPSPPTESVAAPTKPWNLRSRLRSGSTPGAPPALGPPAEDRSQRVLRMSPAETASVPATAAEEGEEGRAWPKISITLTPEEIEEDIYALTGARPRRRPRKRPRALQRQLDSVFPGLWLPEITPESYKVEEEA